jgi:inositol oxygenase
MKRTLHRWEKFVLSEHVKDDEHEIENVELTKDLSGFSVNLGSAVQGTNPNSSSPTLNLEDARAESARRVKARKSYGIADLFATSARSSHQNHNGHYSFRMEHRMGGLGCGQHPNEERLLLFRSDRPACIGKIIYSSHAPKRTFVGGSKERDSFFQHRHPDADWCSQRDLEFGKDDSDALASAKIHMLDVKEEYRGRDLGGLLFHEAVSSLLESYSFNEPCEERGGGWIPCQESDARKKFENHLFYPPLTEECQFARNPTVLCQLDAEEDTRRHNKLIHYYEDLGCQIKPSAKIRYINNNDGETYRKVPMQLPLRVLERSRRPLQRPVTPDNIFFTGTTPMPTPIGDAPLQSCVTMAECSLVGHASFLPIRLMMASDPQTCRLSVKTRCHLDGVNVYGRERRLEWIITNCTEEGGVSFRSTQGWHLCAEPYGNVLANRPLVDEWECFKLRRVFDMDRADEFDTGCNGNGFSTAQRKEMWTLQTCHGTFLTADAGTRTLTTSDHPILWTADSSQWTLACTMDYPQKRLFYQGSWATQCVKYVQTMQCRYLNFDLARMTLKQALDTVSTIPWYRFCTDAQTKQNNVPSLRSYLFHTAEQARLAGEPDWVMLVALIHDLARVVPLLQGGSAKAGKREDDFDWTLKFPARVIGCDPSPSINFPEYKTLNPDWRNPRFAGKTGMYEEHVGLDDVLLSWSGPEYMYHMLRRNRGDNNAVPEEGIKMLRYFLLNDWHVHDAYSALANDDDDDLKPFVRAFDHLISSAKRSSVKDLSDHEIEELWEEYYLPICQKYGVDNVLMW